MNDKDKIYLQACLYAINKLAEKGSCRYSWKDSDGNWNAIAWSEVCDWISEKLNAECEDAVSRAAVDHLCFEFLRPATDSNVAFYEHLMDLPSVTPVRKKGKWIVLKDEYGDIVEAVCSCCEDNGNHKWKYCHTCGAEMEYEE